MPKVDIEEPGSCPSRLDSKFIRYEHRVLACRFLARDDDLRGREEERDGNGGMCKSEGLKCNGRRNSHCHGSIATDIVGMAPSKLELTDQIEESYITSIPGSPSVQTVFLYDQ